MPPKLAWLVYKPIFEYINTRYAFDSYESFYGNGLAGSTAAFCESSLHELCHYVLLGSGPTAAHPFADLPGRKKVGKGTAYIGDRVRAIALKSKDAADEHELDTCATEVLVSRKLGLPIDIEKLVTYASDNMQTRGAVKPGVWVSLAKKRLSSLKLRAHSRQIYALIMKIGRDENFLPLAGE